MSDEFPNNSQRAAKGEKALTEETELQIEKIIDGNVVVRKPSGFKRFRQSFIAGDASSVSEHIFWNLVIPSAKDALADTLSTFVDMMIYGEKRSRVGGGIAPVLGMGTTSKINYGAISTGGASPANNQAIIKPQQQKFSPNEMYLPTRAEAELVLVRMFEVLKKYKSVSVANLNAMVGQSSDMIDYKWGWTDLSTADFRRRGELYHLILPPPQDLN